MTNIESDGGSSTFTGKDYRKYCDYFTQDVKNCYRVG